MAKETLKTSPWANWEIPKTSPVAPDKIPQPDSSWASDKYSAIYKKPITYRIIPNRSTDDKGNFEMTSN